MSKFLQKIEHLPVIERLNQFYAMPVIWWCLLAAVLPFCFSLAMVPVVLRVGLLFMLINPLLSYHIGKLIGRLKLRRWWVLLLPVLFCLVVLLHFAKYNLIFCLIYLIFEIFGLMDKQIYLSKRSD
ncbi:hypothetical protein PT285_06155 [Lactobacillus sp. ESL0791]|uniref:hypothetical protein n=1 Tax=Lactobacillus sp. ESL0791 TaxID=2983234 RepID=UPI0023F870DA|nr:hypothetical protein [Lactobacillus sp. ESL0791]MDF7638982.1 hypothetical protein [Lactobacillus sp. ESL0791]